MEVFNRSETKIHRKNLRKNNASVMDFIVEKIVSMEGAPPDKLTPPHFNFPRPSFKKRGGGSCILNH